jgi:cytochrome c556
VRKLPIAIGLFVALTVPGYAADDPIATRQALMDSNGAAAAVAGGIMKDQIPYNPTVAKAAIMTWAAVAHAYGSFFPEGSLDPARSYASPKIWEDRAGFQKHLDEFGTLTAAAVKAAGKDGPPDKAAFVAVAGPVLNACKSCHQDFRLED